jgi:two-component system sensor histidine kinase ChvG
VTIPIQLIQAVVGTVTYESYDFDQLIAAERRPSCPSRSRLSWRS